MDSLSRQLGQCKKKESNLVLEKRFGIQHRFQGLLYLLLRHWGPVYRWQQYARFLYEANLIKGKNAGTGPLPATIRRHKSFRTS